MKYILLPGTYIAHTVLRIKIVFFQDMPGFLTKTARKETISMNENLSKESIFVSAYIWI